MHKYEYPPRRLQSIGKPLTYSALIRDIPKQLARPTTLSVYQSIFICTMTPNGRISPPTLVIYPHLHRNSQCGSCCTVMPGDICFNCGRISTLLVTPRPPPHTSLFTSATHAQKKPALKSTPFVAQYDRLQALLLAYETAPRTCLEQRAFDHQLSEVEDLLDAEKKLAYVHTLAADDSAFIGHEDFFECGRDLVRRSRPLSDSSTRSTVRLSDSSTRSTSRPSGTLSSTLRSGTSEESDILGEDGRPYAYVVKGWLEDVQPSGRSDVRRWLEDVKPSGRTEARLTSRGVDCHLDLGGKIFEWVIFL